MENLLEALTRNAKITINVIYSQEDVKEKEKDEVVVNMTVNFI